MPRSRSRSRAATPAARAARAVGADADARDRARRRPVSTATKVGQLVVFVAALGLLGLYTVSDQLARDEGFHARIGWVSCALLGVAAVVVVLPRVSRARPAGDRADVDLAGLAHDAALTAATVLGRELADRDPRALVSGEPSPALSRAAVDPATSIELSRRTLASELRRLAAGAGVPASARSLVEYADLLFAARWLSGPEAAAIGQVTAVIDAAKATGSVSTAVAQDVDDAVQLLVPLIDERLAHVAAQFDRRGASPNPPYDELDVLDSTEHLDALDEVNEPEPAELGDAPHADEAGADEAGAEAADGEADDGIEIDLREGGPVVTATAEPGATAPPGRDGAAPQPKPVGEPRALTSPSPEPVAWRSST